MLLVALWSWRAKFSSPSARLILRGDAKGVLQDVVAQRARNPGINLIIAEMQLALARSAMDLTALHWWSEDNELCDMLSRGVVPPILHSSTCVAATRRIPWKMLTVQVRARIANAGE